MDEASVTIAAAPEQVWATVTDITNMGKWSPSNTGGKWTKGASGPAAGAHFAAWNKKGVARWVTHCEVIECEEPSKFAFQVTENHMQWGWKIAATEDGGTELTQWRHRTAMPALPIRMFVKMLWGGIDQLDANMVDGMRDTLNAIKRDLEATPAPA